MLAKALSFTVVVLLALGATAYAAQPPGGATDEYTEGVPGGGGETPSGDAGSHGDNSSGGSSETGSSVPAATQSQLQSSGADGAAALSLIEETGPADSPSGNAKDAGSDGQGSKNGAEDASSPNRGSGVAGVVKALTGDDSGGGLGVLLPIALIVIALGAAALALARRGGSEATG